MRFALVNNARVLAEPKLQGLCAGCAQPVVAKCGKQRIWHWAHLTKKTCDRWWEPETEWHREWKNKFHPDWQEYIQHDQSGEKHIADVRTRHGLVIEFQHSHLDPEERTTRERFYGKMVWVVDGMLLKRDYVRFLKGKVQLKSTLVKRYFLTPNPGECFARAWVESPAPVVFDFREATPAVLPVAESDSLWCLLPGRTNGNAVVVEISRGEFVALACRSTDPALELVSNFLQGTKAAMEIIRQFQQRPKPSIRLSPQPIRRRWRL